MDIGNLLGGGDVIVDVPFLDDAVVRIRYIPRDELLKLYGKATRTTWDRKRQPVTTTDEDLANRLLAEAAVMGWSGITEKGQELPFTPENRDRLMMVWGEFFKFVNECCTDLSRLMEAERESSKKKSVSTSEPGGTSPA